MKQVLTSRQEMKIVRRRWAVRIWTGLSAGSLTDAFSAIPRDAEITRLIEEDMDFVLELEQEADQSKS